MSKENIQTSRYVLDKDRQKTKTYEYSGHQVSGKYTTNLEFSIEYPGLSRKEEQDIEHTLRMFQSLLVVALRLTQERGCDCIFDMELQLRKQIQELERRHQQIREIESV